MQDLSILICEKLGLNPNVQLKKPIRGLSGFNTAEFISALINTTNLDQAAYTLGYTINPIKQCTKNILIPLFQDRHKEYGIGGGSAPWYFVLLSAIEHKKCLQCNRILPYTKFHKDVSKPLCLSSECGNCKTYSEKLRKIDIKYRCPSWADISSIKDFYINCPEGCHVDHIIPLRGKLVSGLHVLENLQYLTAEENMAKGNKFDIS